MSDGSPDDAGGSPGTGGSEHEPVSDGSGTVGGGDAGPPPDPDPVGGVGGAPDDEEMPLTDHIEEMVRRLGIVLVVMALVSLVVFPVADRLINGLWYSFLPGPPTECVQSIVGVPAAAGNATLDATVGAVNRTVATTTADGTVVSRLTNGTVTRVTGNGTVAALVESGPINGTVTNTTFNGVVNATVANGSVTAATIEGTVNATFANGTATTAPVNGTLANGVPVGSTEAACPRLYHPLSLVLSRLKVASLVGLIVALPVFVYQTYLFMRPGLYPNERRYYLASVPTSLVLAAVGVAFAYFLVLPIIFIYFLGYSQPVAEVAFALSQTFDLILLMLGTFAVIFQIPLFVMLAIMMGVTSRRWLEARRLYFWAAFAGIAFIFSPDPTGMAPFIVAATMILLFEGTLVLLRWTGR